MNEIIQIGRFSPTVIDILRNRLNLSDVNWITHLMRHTHPETRENASGFSLMIITLTDLEFPFMVRKRIWDG